MNCYMWYCQHFGLQCLNKELSFIQQLGYDLNVFYFFPSLLNLLSLSFLLEVIVTILLWFEPTRVGKMQKESKLDMSTAGGISFHCKH